MDFANCQKSDKDAQILFTDLPFQTVSDNNLYFNNGRGGRWPTYQLKEFKELMRRWAMANIYTIKHAKEIFTSKDVLQMKIFLGCPHDRLFTKDGSIKKFDPQNWTKALIDSMAELIEIDDRNFWKVEVEKLESNQCQSEVALWIGKYKPRTFEEVFHVQNYSEDNGSQKAL